ncbi:MAG: double-strand break repair protein AddB [Pseudomonadota bacterium]
MGDPVAVPADPFAGDGPSPRLFAVPPGADYAAVLVSGLTARLAHAPPEAMASVSIIVNSARARTAIEAAFAARADGGPCYLPQVTSLETLADAPPPTLVTAPLPPRARPVSPTVRLMALTRLVEAYCHRTGMAPAAAPGLARSLADLLDLMDEEGVDLARLAEAGAADLPDPESMAGHWQRALDFLSIAREAWPELRAALGEGEAPPQADPRAAQRVAIAALLEGWQACPPAGPVIVAGSTGSRAIAAMLMAAVAKLPSGAVVLPGLDPDAAGAVWPAVQAGAGDHPSGPFRRLFAMLGTDPGAVRAWDVRPDDTQVPRRRLLAEALRPAPVTDAWVAARETIAAEAEAATNGLSLIEAPEQRVEAGAIALAVREALENPGQHIAIVTPDATLARRITAALARFDILPDDSLGRPLAQAPAAVFLRLVLRVAMAAAESRVDTVALAGLMGHPLTHTGSARADHRRNARRFEIAVLRARGPVRPGRGGALPEWHGAGEDERTWQAGIDAALAPLVSTLQGPAPLGEVIGAMRDACQALSAPADPESDEGARTEAEAPSRDPSEGSWQGPDGIAARRVLDALAEAAPAYGGTMAPAMLSGVLETLLSAEALPPEAARPHPRVTLRGTMEARHETADLTVLAGLVEGRWPGTADPGPWLNRPLRAALAIPAPEREIGLAAHDFLQGACRGTVILTQSRAIEGTPMIASRWLTRLETLLSGTHPKALEAMRARGRRWLDLVPLLDAPGKAESADPHLAPAPRPAPRPARALRPRTLSVTRLERLIRDPYAVYAESVLGLKELDPLGAAIDARDRGTALHQVMERLVREGRDRADDDVAVAAALVEALDATLSEGDLPPDLARLWRGRMGRVAGRLAALTRRIRAAGETLGLEVKGAIALPVPGGDLAITARADRIDRASDGRGLVYDYKSGAPPSKKQIGRFAHQLHAQALIAAEGGFEGVPPLPPGNGAYIGLAAAKEAAPDPPLATLLDAYRADLIAFLTRFDDPATPYISRRVVEKREDTGPYDHVARVAEWAGDGVVDPTPEDGR